MRLPTIYLPHGGGPWPFVDVRFGPAESWAPLRGYLEGLYAPFRANLRAVVCVTAHFEAPVPTATSSARPPMLYDYGGFPPAAYEIEWPAPGSPALAARVRELLGAAGIPSAEDAARGFDHGTFVPLKLADPRAEVPTVQLSLVQGLDPETHLAVGRALAPLRDEGVLLIGSGSSFHNLRALFQVQAQVASRAFHSWLESVLSLSPEERTRALAEWTLGPEARYCHPREEHLIPLHVVLGAGGDDLVSFPFRGKVLDAQMLAVQFG